MTEFTVRPIAHIKNDYTEKFGIPRQSGLAEEIISEIVFEKDFRVKEAFRLPSALPVSEETPEWVCLQHVRRSVPILSGYPR